MSHRTPNISDSLQDLSVEDDDASHIFEFEQFFKGLFMSKEMETKEDPEDPVWVSASDGLVPGGAVYAGHLASEETYVARVKHEGKWVPAQLVPSKKKCFYDVFSKTKYQVLCNCSPTWSKMTAPESSIPQRALQVDILESKGSQSFIGRVHLNKDVFLGKVDESSELLYIAPDGERECYDHYEILTLPTAQLAALQHHTRGEISKRHKKTQRKPRVRRDQQASSDEGEIRDRRHHCSSFTSSDEDSRHQSLRRGGKTDRRRRWSSDSGKHEGSRVHPRQGRAYRSISGKVAQRYPWSNEDKSGKARLRFSASEDSDHESYGRRDKHISSGEIGGSEAEVPRGRDQKSRHKHGDRGTLTRRGPMMDDDFSLMDPNTASTWVRAEDGDVPQHAVAGGSNYLGKVYVARTSHRGALLPGKLIPSYKYCYISIQGKEIKSRNYEVLCNVVNEQWEKMTSKDTVPRNAVRGGHNHEQEDVFIGRVLTKNMYTVGKIEKINDKFQCLILLRQQEISHSDFEILTETKDLRASLSMLRMKHNLVQRSAAFSVRPSTKLTINEGSWEEAENGAVPLGAVIGGSNEQGDIFVARGEHDGAILPGKLLPSKGYFFTSSKDGKEVLCNCDAHWQQMNVENGDEIPEKAIPGGVLSSGEPIYIGRVHHRGGNGITCGMVNGSSGVCTVVYGMKGHDYNQYDILVLATAGEALPYSPARLARKFVTGTIKKHNRNPQVKDIKQGLWLVTLKSSDPEYSRVSDLMSNTIRQHAGNIGGVFTKYNISKIEKIEHALLKKRYDHYAEVIKLENSNELNEKVFFHGSPFWESILETGFDERNSTINGMFGAGIYFGEHSSKSNQYVFGFSQGNKCPLHSNNSCYVCDRHLIVCNVALGKTSPQSGAFKVPHAPAGHHSVTGLAGANLKYAEYVVYRGEQALATHLITYKIVK